MARTYTFEIGVQYGFASLEHGPPHPDFILLGTLYEASGGGTEKSLLARISRQARMMRG